MFKMFNKLKSNTNKCFVFHEVMEKIYIYKKVHEDTSFVGCVDFENLNSEITSFCKKDKDFYSFDIYWILGDSKYEIVNIEKVPLNNEEIAEYVKWKVKDVVNIPSDDIVTEVIFCEGKDHPFFEKNLTVFVSDKKELFKIYDVLRKNKLRLKVIDVPELAARNLFVDLGIETTAVHIYFKILSEVTMFSVFMGDSLLLSRKVERGFDTIPVEMFNEKILLEVQRSIDFLDRQHNVSQFSHFYVSSENKGLVEKFTEDMSNYFRVKNIPLVDSDLAPEILGEFLRMGKV